MRWSFVGRRERLRREAADWIARLNGADGERHRGAFERWYGASPEHAAAYDRLSALFNVAGRASRRSAAASSPAPRRQGPFSSPGRYALAAAVAIVALLTCVLVFARAPVADRDAGPQIASFEAGSTAARKVVLADGSEVLLSPGSALDVAFDAHERRLRLSRGEARFSVAHEARPFTVTAGGAEVVARGTEFVVALAGGRTTVALLVGRVDVTYAPTEGDPNVRSIARLRPGERLVVELPTSAAAAAGEQAAASRPLPALPSSPTDSAGAEPALRRAVAARFLIQFDDTPLGEAVETVSGHGGPPIRFGDPALARLRITGAFRPGDSGGFADSVAAAFGLEAERAPDRVIWLKRRTPEPRPR